MSCIVRSQARRLLPQEQVVCSRPWLTSHWDREMEPSISVALCADKNFEVGLHVTLYSLLESQSKMIKIFLLLIGQHVCDVPLIHKTLEPFSGNFELEVICLDDSMFRGYRGLHGSHCPYIRLMLPNILSGERVIYLDCDLIVQKDLCGLYNENLNGYALGVAGVERIEDSLELNFFESLGFNREAKYFNSGVILIDLDKWRETDIIQRSIEFANKYPTKLKTADQTILNYLFYEDNFLEIDSSYNVAIYPGAKSIINNQEMNIYHFMGSPKPWDFFGEVLHGNYDLFHSFLSKTAMKHYKSYNNISAKRVKRSAWLSRSYLLCIKNRLLS